MKQAVLYDFHGTLADTREIVHLVKERKFDEFYTASLSCPPIPGVVLAARHSHRAGYVNILFTGMREQYRDGLLNWLREQDVHIDILRMRPDESREKDFVLKRSMFLEVAQEFSVIRAWEDSPAVIDLWARQGIRVVTVPGWV